MVLQAAQRLALPACGRAWILLGSGKNSKPENAAREASHTACPEPVEGSDARFVGLLFELKDSLTLNMSLSSAYFIFNLLVNVSAFSVSLYG